MTDMKFVKSYSEIEPSPQQSRRIWERLEKDAAELDISLDYDVVKHTGRPKVMRTVLIAAVITALMVGTAFATDFLGVRALMQKDREGIILQLDGDGGVQEMDKIQVGDISITQPQALPDDIDPAVAEKVANSEAAWAEWIAWKNEHAAKGPEVYEPPEGSDAWNEEQNADGTWTISFLGYDIPEGTPPDERGDIEPTIVETRIATAEEHAKYEEYMESIANGYGDYDFNYDILTKEQADKLEEIAAKYGLSLRHARKIMARETKQEIIDQVTSLNSGNIFLKEPDGFDKMYYFDEGTFCVSFYATVPSTGEQVTCYGYNSMYSTLSSGDEVNTGELDVAGLQSRDYVTADGTKVTILSNEPTAFHDAYYQSAYIYVYLEDSFFAEHISGSTQGMTDEDINALADYISYSLINK